MKNGIYLNPCCPRPEKNKEDVRLRIGVRCSMRFFGWLERERHGEIYRVIMGLGLPPTAFSGGCKKQTFGMKY